jgi:hypothetical protein
MTRGHKAIIAAIVVPVSFAAVPMLGLARADDFSWQAHLGQPAEDLRHDIGSVATCILAAPLEFSFPSRPQVFSPGDWEMPLGGGFVEKRRSNIIEVLTCVAEDNVRIKALAHAGKVFRITISYPRCRNLVDCDLAEKSHDRTIVQSLVAPLIYAPLSSNSYSENKRYFEKYPTDKKDEYLKRKLLDA